MDTMVVALKRMRGESTRAREDKKTGTGETTSFSAFPSPIHCKLNFVILLLMQHIFTFGWEGNVDFSQSAFFPKDRRDRALCVTCDHPGLKCSESSMAMNVKLLT